MSGGGRLAAARALSQVLDHGRSLDPALSDSLAELSAGPDRALARRLAHAVLRDWPAIQALTSRLLHRPPARRDRLLLFVVAVALAELRDGREPERAVVHSAVESARAGGLARLSGLTNALLRRFLRERAALEADLAESEPVRYGYPAWLIDAIRHDWPAEWASVLAEGNRPPPLWLRVNQRYWTLAEARQALIDAGHEVELPDKALPDALCLPRRARISDLPGFAEGGLSVQDGAAQLTADYLALSDGLRVLDACSAPGGKAAHLLERADVDLTAVELDGQRLDRVATSLERLGLRARLIVGDASQPRDWWDGQPFDRILIDAPCSATGVIRRHPDIRWLRQPGDIEALARTQARLLSALWPLLAPGGILVYATCSILAAENVRQAQAFLESHDHCEAIDHAELPGRACAVGRQILPGDHDLDGFYHLAVRRLPG